MIKIIILIIVMTMTVTVTVTMIMTKIFNLILKSSKTNYINNLGAPLLVRKEIVKNKMKFL